MEHYKSFLLQALDMASQQLGFCAPNPAVGAIVVRDGMLISQGFHHGPGQPHAEVEALNQVTNAQDCDLYVTLEPCCHYGRTPPCTELIISKGIKRVFFSLLDPNPQVAGNGQRRLREAGVVCEHVPLKAIDNFYRPYRYWWCFKRPYVTVKIALSQSHQLPFGALTGKECQYETQRQRYRHDALLTTVRTLQHDDPQLNVRLIDPAVKKPLFILDRNINLSPTARVVSTCAPVVVFYHQAQSKRLAELEAVGVICVSMPLLNNQLDLDACFQYIAELGYHSVWVEAGWTLFSALLRYQHLQQVIIYVAPDNPQVSSKPIQFSYERGQSRQIEFDMLGHDLKIVISSSN